MREEVRQQLGHNPCPSVAILDSQSVKTTEKGAERLRWLQTTASTQASSAGRCARDAVRGRADSSECERRAWGRTTAVARSGALSAFARGLGGPGLQRL